ncbi:MAG: hypothetical protein Q4Q53_02035 [Methanocorpusculum sp.]|nr:hypothetical protein [Methanocorpusculum sp.]
MKKLIIIILLAVILLTAGCIDTNQRNSYESEMYVVDVSDWITAENAYQKWNLPEEKIRAVADGYEKKIGKPDENGYYRVDSAEIEKLCGLNESQTEEYVISVACYPYPTTHQIGVLRIESVRSIENISAPLVYWNNLLGWNLSNDEVSEIIASLKTEFEKYYGPSVYSPDRYFYTVSERVFVYRVGVLANLDSDSMTEFYNNHRLELEESRWSPVTENTEILKEWGSVQNSSKIYLWQESGGLPYKKIEDELDEFGLEYWYPLKIYPDGNIYCSVYKLETAKNLKDEDWDKIYKVFSESAESLGIYNLPVKFISYPYNFQGIMPTPTPIPDGEIK